MAKKGFKFGEKVVPKNPKCWLCKNRIWIVDSVDLSTNYVRCKENGELVKKRIQSFEQKELKHLYEKDSQMLFPFLDKYYMCLHCEVKNTCPTARLSF